MRAAVLTSKGKLFREKRRQPTWGYKDNLFDTAAVGVGGPYIHVVDGDSTRGGFAQLVRKSAGSKLATWSKDLNWRVLVP